MMHSGLNEFSQAKPLIEAALPYFEKSARPDQVDYLRMQLIVCHEQADEYPQTLPMMNQVIEARTKRWGATHTETRQAHHRRALTLIRLKQFAETETELADYLLVMKTDAKITPAERRDFLFQLITAQVMQGKSDAAEATIAEWRALGLSPADDQLHINNWRRLLSDNKG
jgi:hypothetical protein